MNNNHSSIEENNWSDNKCGRQLISSNTPIINMIVKKGLVFYKIRDKDFNLIAFYGRKVQ